MGALRPFLDRFRDLAGRRRWHLAGLVADADEVPSEIRRRRAIVVGARAPGKWLVFDCPCAERHRVMLNLDPSRTPHWTIGTAEPLTVFPSVDAPNEAGRCHYFIRRGRIEWVRTRTTRRRWLR
jgi:hypothetical protein